MRTILCFTLLLFALQPLPAQTTLTGKVLDADDGQPLYFATIAVVGQPYGTLSQADGEFVLKATETLAPDSRIIVSYLGYDTEEYTLKNLGTGKNIMLSRASFGLPTISVLATEELTSIELGRKERKANSFYQTFHDQTYQLATRVLNPKKQAGVLSEIKYYFGKAAKGGKSVRLNFYDVDPACDCPGKPLHAASIIPEKNKPRWNRVNLSSSQVELPARDFFVAFEWLGIDPDKRDWLDFSIGVVPVKNAPKTYEKVGGTAWAESVKRGVYRPLVRVVAKVE